jgi:hypothetical protein
MQWHRLVACLGLRIPEVIPHTGSPDIDLHKFEVDVCPGERNQLKILQR